MCSGRVLPLMSGPNSAADTRGAPMKRSSRGGEKTDHAGDSQGSQGTASKQQPTACAKRTPPPSEQQHSQVLTQSSGSDSSSSHRATKAWVLTGRAWVPAGNTAAACRQRQVPPETPKITVAAADVRRHGAGGSHGSSSSSCGGAPRIRKAGGSHIPTAALSTSSAASTFNPTAVMQRAHNSVPSSQVPSVASSVHCSSSGRSSMDSTRSSSSSWMHSLNSHREHDRVVTVVTSTGVLAPCNSLSCVSKDCADYPGAPAEPVTGGVCGAQEKQCQHDAQHHAIHSSYSDGLSVMQFPASTPTSTRSSWNEAAEKPCCASAADTLPLQAAPLSTAQAKQASQCSSDQSGAGVTQTCKDDAIRKQQHMTVSLAQPPTPAPSPASAAPPPPAPAPFRLELLNFAFLQEDEEEDDDGLDFCICHCKGRGQGQCMCPLPMPLNPLFYMRASSSGDGMGLCQSERPIPMDVRGSKRPSLAEPQDSADTTLTAAPLAASNTQQPASEAGGSSQVTAQAPVQPAPADAAYVPAAAEHSPALTEQNLASASCSRVLAVTEAEMAQVQAGITQAEAAQASMQESSDKEHARTVKGAQEVQQGSSAEQHASAGPTAVQQLLQGLAHVAVGLAAVAVTAATASPPERQQQPEQPPVSAPSIAPWWTRLRCSSGFVAMHWSMQCNDDAAKSFTWSLPQPSWLTSAFWQRAWKHASTLHAETYVHYPLPLRAHEAQGAGEDRQQWEQRMERWRGWRQLQHQAAGSAWSDSSDAWSALPMTQTRNSLLDLPLCQPRSLEHALAVAYTADTQQAEMEAAQEQPMLVPGNTLESLDGALDMPQPAAPGRSPTQQGALSSRRSPLAAAAAAASPPDYYYLRPNRMVLKSPLRQATGSRQAAASPTDNDDYGGGPGLAARAVEVAGGGGGVQFRWLRGRVVWMFPQGVPQELGEPTWM